MGRRRGRNVAAVELDAGIRRVIGRQYPELAGHAMVVAIAAHDDDADNVRRVIDRLVEAANDGRRLQIEQLIDAILPLNDVPTPPLLEEARRQALQRARLLRDVGAYTAQEVAELAGSHAVNRSQVAHRWKKEGRIFGVHHRSAVVYLGFQFGTDGHPRPVIRDVLRAMAGWPEWEVALWFAVKNDLLDRRSPLDLLDDDPAAVIAAAREAERLRVPA